MNSARAQRSEEAGRNPLRPCARKTAPEQAATAKYIRPATPNGTNIRETATRAAVYCTTLRRVWRSPSGSFGRTSNPARANSVLRKSAIARKCGTCHRNRMANSTNAGGSMLPVAAVHPMSGGMAPATAPTKSDAVLRRFSGAAKRAENTDARGAWQPRGGPTTEGRKGKENAGSQKAEGQA